MDNERSYESITSEHLERLSRIAAVDRADRFARRPRWRPYSKQVLCVALCQGAARHYVDGVNGIKDFDVFTFYPEHPVGPFPPRWRITADFGPSVFGRYPPDPDEFTGRRVDLIGRSLPVAAAADPVEAVREYLRNPSTATAHHLSKMAVVALDPPQLRGIVIWPEASSDKP